MLLRPAAKLCRTVGGSFFQKRNTVIVKRVHKPPLIGDDPFSTPQRVLDEAVVHSDDDKWMLYEVEEKFQPHHKVKLILLRNVDDYGKKGQVINVFFHNAYKHLLLPKFAVYHSKENVELYKDIIIPEDANMYSSDYVQDFINKYSKRVFDICMNMDVPWLIEPWHIKASLRKHKIWVKSAEDITIPGGRIEGPDQSLENKEFIATLTINNKEQMNLRCRIHHLGNPHKQYWFLDQAEPVFESERQQLLDMNRAPPSKLMRETKELKDDIEKFNKWKYERELRLA